MWLDGQSNHVFKVIASVGCARALQGAQTLTIILVKYVRIDKIKFVTLI